MYWKLFGVRITEDEDRASRIRVGADYQAEIPECVGDNERSKQELLRWNHISSDRGKLLWNPSVLPEQQFESYLRSVGCQCALEEEKALWLLHECNYNVEEALRRNRYMPSINYHDDEAWTESDRNLFEKGLQKYGKNFHAIQKLIRWKSVPEIVEYYYSWKMKSSQSNGHSH